SVANVETDFASAPLVPVAVPNTSPPPKPLLIAKGDVDLTRATPYQARLEVKIPRGLVVPAECRVRRSRVSSDPHLMPVIAVQSISNTPPGPQEFEFVDLGPSSIEPAGVLRPWVPYQWIIEGRGAPAPG